MHESRTRERTVGLGQGAGNRGYVGRGAGSWRTFPMAASTGGAETPRMLHVVSCSAIELLGTVASTTWLGEGTSARCASIRWRTVTRNAPSSGSVPGRRYRRPATVSMTRESGCGAM